MDLIRHNSRLQGLPAVFNNADTAPVGVSFKTAPSALRLRQPPHLAARAEQMLAGTTWLPEPSLTPVNESGDTQAMTSKFLPVRLRLAAQPVLFVRVKASAAGRGCDPERRERSR